MVYVVASDDASCWLSCAVWWNNGCLDQFWKASCSNSSETKVSRWKCHLGRRRKGFWSLHFAQASEKRWQQRRSAALSTRILVSGRTSRVLIPRASTVSTAKWLASIIHALSWIGTRLIETIYSSLLGTLASTPSRRERETRAMPIAVKTPEEQAVRCVFPDGEIVCCESASGQLTNLLNVSLQQHCF